VIGRQQHVMRAFDGLRQSRRPLDLGRVQAIEYLDSALGADRRQLIKQYVENHDAAGKLAERIWQASYDLTQGFLSAYQVALEEALRQDGSSRWGAALPLLFARLLHYYGTDAKLRVFRFERWIPGKWMELHRAYLRCTELGVDRADFRSWVCMHEETHRVQFTANHSDTLMTEMLEREISDRIGISETVTGVDDSYHINAVDIECRGGDLIRCAWTLFPASTGQYWLLGVAGRSELGVTTILGYGLF